MAIEWTDAGLGAHVLAESARWDAAGGRWSWLDIRAGTAHRWDPRSTTQDVVDFGQRLGALVPASGGRTVLVRRGDVGLLDWESRAFDDVVPFPIEDTERLNDATADPSGRIWVGSLDITARPGMGRLWSMRIGEAPRLERSGLTVPNGIHWSPDGSCAYFADSRAHLIYRITLTRGGALGQFEPLLETGVGEPDGLTVDSEGDLWVALWDGRAIARYRPDGSLRESFDAPALRPTSLAFGGAGFNQLLLTTGRANVADDDPQIAAAGRLFLAEAAATGFPGFEAA